MKFKFFLPIAFASLHLCGAEQKIGVVNFSHCVTESKLGKQEQNAVETMRKQLVSLIEDTEKKYREEADKLQDKDFLDGLSKEGEEAIHHKIAGLQDELGRYQQQYQQFMYQGQGRIVQSVLQGITSAVEPIATAQGFDFVINKEACFFVKPGFDLTAEVVDKMNKEFDTAEKK